MFRRLLVTCALCWAALTAWAEVPGEDALAYRDAMEIWLSGADDLQALEVWAGLANQDNLAAQLTLGLIGRAGTGLAYVQLALSPEDRKRLFRKADGRFGKRWLTVVGDKVPVAALLLKSVNQDDDLRARAKALAEQGRIKDALDVANIAYNLSGGWEEFAAIGTIPPLYPYAKHSIYPMLEEFEQLQRTVPTRTADDERRAAFVDQFLKNQPKPTFSDRLLQSQLGGLLGFEDFEANAPRIRMRGAALLHHPELAPIAEVIRDVCPKDTAYQMGLLFHLRSGTYLLLDQLSDMEPMISTEAWQQSGRFRKDLMHKWWQVLRRHRMALPNETCLSQAIAEAGVTVSHP